jgi:hypothetical protein
MPPAPRLHLHFDRLQWFVVHGCRFMAESEHHITRLEMKRRWIRGLNKYVKL